MYTNHSSIKAREERSDSFCLRPWMNALLCHYLSIKHQAAMEWVVGTVPPYKFQVYNLKQGNRKNLKCTPYGFRYKQQEHTQWNNVWRRTQSEANQTPPEKGQWEHASCWRLCTAGCRKWISCAMDRKKIKPVVLAYVQCEKCTCSHHGHNWGYVFWNPHRDKIIHTGSNIHTNTNIWLNNP